MRRGDARDGVRKGQAGAIERWPWRRRLSIGDSGSSAYLTQASRVLFELNQRVFGGARRPREVTEGRGRRALDWLVTGTGVDVRARLTTFLCYFSCPAHRLVSDTGS